MKHNYRLITSLIGFLILYSVFAAVFDAIEVLQGNIDVLDSPASPLWTRALREIILIIIIAIWLMPKLLEFSRTKAMKGSFISYSFMILITLYCLILSVITLLKYPFIVPIAGLRMFEYVPILFIVRECVINYGNNRILSIFSKFFKIYIIIEATFCIVELLFAPPYWGTTFLGSRVFGTFTLPNVFGIMVAELFFYFLIFEEKTSPFWLLILFALTMLSGSRMATLLCLIEAIIYFYLRLKSQSTKAIFLLIIPVVFILLFQVVNMQELTGRDTYNRGIQEEERLAVWQEIFKGHDNATDLLFGWGVGLASNTITTLQGYISGMSLGFIADSTYVIMIVHFGLLGLLLLLVILFLPLLKLKGETQKKWIMLLVFFLVAASSMSVFEVFPTNVLFFTMCGLVLGQSKNN